MMTWDSSTLQYYIFTPGKWMKYSCQKITLIWAPFEAFEDNLQHSSVYSNGLSVYMAGRVGIIYCMLNISPSTFQCRKWLTGSEDSVLCGHWRSAAINADLNQNFDRYVFVIFNEWPLNKVKIWRSRSSCKANAALIPRRRNGFREFSDTSRSKDWASAWIIHILLTEYYGKRSCLRTLVLDGCGKKAAIFSFSNPPFKLYIKTQDN